MQICRRTNSFGPRAGADRARIGKKPDGLLVGFTGHFDIAPLGAQPKSAFEMTKHVSTLLRYRR
jgi:hypothetical protein